MTDKEPEYVEMTDAEFAQAVCDWVMLGSYVTAIEPGPIDDEIVRFKYRVGDRVRYAAIHTSDIHGDAIWETVKTITADAMAIAKEQTQ